MRSPIVEIWDDSSPETVLVELVVAAFFVDAELSFWMSALVALPVIFEILMAFSLVGQRPTSTEVNGVVLRNLELARPLVRTV
jgi:hypothetical protein